MRLSPPFPDQSSGLVLNGPSRGREPSHVLDEDFADSCREISLFFVYDLLKQRIAFRLRLSSTSSVKGRN